jgi:hypothetical protein
MNNKRKMKKKIVKKKKRIPATCEVAVRGLRSEAGPGQK